MYNTYLFFIDGGVGRIFSGVGGDARRREDVIDDRVFVKRMQGKCLRMMVEPLHGTCPKIQNTHLPYVNCVCFPDLPASS